MATFKLYEYKALKLEGRSATVMHNSSGKLIKSPFLCPLQLPNTQSHQLSHLPPPLPSLLQFLQQLCNGSLRLQRSCVLCIGVPGKVGLCTSAWPVFSVPCGTEEAHARDWCAAEQRGRTISFLHAWLGLSVGTERLRG